jgi:DNA-directed RNA polymerase II subunit RPB1
MQCSFEETTDILLEASMAGMKDPLTGVSENIMLGQVAPIGTGSFSLLVNETMLKDVVEPDGEDVEATMARPLRSPGGVGGPVGGGMDRPGSTWTPRAARSGSSPFTVRAATPSMAYSPAAWAGTPVRAGSVRGASPFASRMSPGDDDAQFSPNPMTPGNATGTRRGGAAYGRNSAFTPMQSPGRDWAAPVSPGGGGASPFAASPMYGGLSPAAGVRSRANGNASPFAAPSSSGYRATSPGPNYGAGPSPAFGGGGSSYSPTSPAYQASPAASPAFQVASPGASYSPSSPAFSPGAASPQYSPSSPAIGLQSPYHPGGASPQYQAASPTYRYVTAGG